MKRFTYLLSITVAAFAIAAIGMIGCEGPAGATGQAGTDGADGENGIDANETCKVCHDDGTDLLAKQLQAGASGHMTGGHFRYGDRTDCSVCHTHEGFLAVMGTADYLAPAEYKDATPPNCRTCHLVHETYTASDFAVRVTDPVTFWFNNVEADLGTSNMCIACHQPRMGDLDPLPVVGGADLVIDDDGWGYPHQSQSSMVYGTGGYETTGSASYPAAGSTTHASTGCVGCHMSEPARGNTAGGHTTLMNYESRGTAREFTQSCEVCHTDADFDYLNIQTDVETMMDSLEVLLTTKGVMLDGDLNASSAAPLTMTADEAGAYLNLQMVGREKSGGVHNPKYIKALLSNSIAAMQ